jgi:hypothetical protein
MLLLLLFSRWNNSIKWGHFQFQTFSSSVQGGEKRRAAGCDARPAPSKPALPFD